MAQIGNVPEIIEIKNQLKQMKQDGLVLDWELPYENLLTRRSAAIFFLTPVSEGMLPEIWQNFAKYDGFRQCKNSKKSLSNLDYKIEFGNIE